MKPADFSSIRNQKGFTLIELMVVAVILAIISAIAIPIYNGYKKDAYAQEAYETVSKMADLCIGKIIKAKETGGTVGTVTPANTTDNFSYSVATACSATGGSFQAEGQTPNMEASDTLIVTVGIAGNIPTKTFSGSLN